MVGHLRRAGRLVPAVCLLLLLGTAGAAAQGTTALFFQSQTGDYIGGGQTKTYTPADGTFTIGSSANAVTGRVVGPSLSFWWDFSFSAPSGTPLLPGVYNQTLIHI
jgi:peptidoglycan/LPS O-acetylase OafA/YrhL